MSLISSLKLKRQLFLLVLYIKIILFVRLMKKRNNQHIISQDSQHRTNFYKKNIIPFIGVESK